MSLLKPRAGQRPAAVNYGAGADAYVDGSGDGVPGETVGAGLAAPKSGD